MKLGSIECTEALRGYEAKTKSEALAMNVLLRNSILIAEGKRIVRPSTMTGLKGPELLTVGLDIMKIREELGIELVK